MSIQIERVLMNAEGLRIFVSSNQINGQVRLSSLPGKFASLRWDSGKVILSFKSEKEKDGYTISEAPDSLNQFLITNLPPFWRAGKIDIWKLIDETPKGISPKGLPVDFEVKGSDLVLSIPQDFFR